MALNNRLRRVLSFSAYLLIALITAIILSKGFHETKAVGDEAPLGGIVLNEQGREVPLRALIKSGINVINFWATYCPPCQKELPALSRLHERYRSSVNFLGIVIDNDRAAVSSLKTTFKLNYPMVFGSNQIMENWKAMAVPTTYVVKNGIIVWAYAGAIRETELDEFLKSLTKLP